MKLRKSMALILAAVSITGALSGCGGEKVSDGNVRLSVGLWPTEVAKDSLETQNAMKDDFMLKNPNIEIVPDTYVYDTKTFTMKAASDQLPNMYKPWFTEINQIIDAGYAADITEQMKEHGFDKALNPDLIELVTRDGKIYGIPTDAYAQGLYINKKLFRDAGLVNADGTIKVPQTYQEVAEFAQIIKEKTGKAGFVLPTTDNCGGWHFTNIAWSHGVEFCKQREDGTWEATFDTPEAVAALQYVKDLKWKYNAFLDDTVINQTNTYKFFGTYQAAMMFCSPPCTSLSLAYGMNISDIFVTRMPEGPKGRFAQMGGNLWMFSKNSTPEQINAGMEWLKFTGFSPVMTEENIENQKKSLADAVKNKSIILDQNAFDIWVDKDRLEKTKEIRADYTNVAHEDYEQYYSFEDVTIRPEPAACAQQLYAILDRCIQEVITNENADCEVLIANACNDYQVNHLDKM